jgi:hypothetical protein
MENLFQNSYDTIFKQWYRMRTALEEKDIQTQCVEVDKWWQSAPLVNHYLHPDLIEEWPNPWELISDNHYCHIARGLGMFYTLYLLGVRELDFVQAKDYNNEDVVLILADHAKYILNYWPDSVVNNNLQDFKIVKHIDTMPIIKKIGLK